MSTPNKKIVFTEFFWYFLGSFVPMLIGLAKNKIFTSVFAPEEFGRYGLIFISFTALSTIFLVWNQNILWRFYHHFDRIKGKDFFLSNNLYIFILQIFVFIIVSAVYYYMADASNKYFVFLFAIQMVIVQILNNMLTLFRIHSLTRIFNIVNILRTALAFILMLYFTFIKHQSIEVYIKGIIWADSGAIVFLFITKWDFFRIKLSKFSISIIKKIVAFVPPSLITNLGWILLVYSDRYIIEYFNGFGAAGIYHQAQQFGQMSLTGIILILSKIVTSKFFKVLERQRESINAFLKSTFLFYISVILPLSFYFSIYSKQIVEMFFGKEFHEAFIIMPWINFSAFFIGMHHFLESKRFFQNKNWKVVSFYISGLILNVVLNIIFVPRFGYLAASISTMFVNIFILILLLYGDIRFFCKEILFNRATFIIVLVLVLQTVVHLLIENFLIDYSFFHCLIEGIIFLSIYSLIMYKCKATKKIFENVYELID